MPASSAGSASSLGTAPSTRSLAPASASLTADDIQFSMAGWRTDFTRHSVDLSEIIPGGPPPDGIPPIDEPRFESVADAQVWLSPGAPLIAVEIDGDVRGYPIAILIWHEIVNDVVGGRPVVVTFCPLCNTAIAFDRRVDGKLLDFGTTGNVRHSDLIMWDRQTETWWQQVTGEGIVGELTGARLEFIPAQMVSLLEFARRWPEARVLSRETGVPRQYGYNPYPGYDELGSMPFLFQGVVDGRLAPKERVVAISLGGQSMAFPFTELRKARIGEVSLGGVPIVVFWAPGTASPLSREDVQGGDIGAVGAFDRRLDGRTLTFRHDGRRVDAETGSTWALTGIATAGPLRGRQLARLVYSEPFWFAWAAFDPKTTIWTAP